MTDDDRPTPRLTRDRLEDERNIWFCSVRPDGTPHVVPVWFVYVADDFWVVTGEGSRKTRNLASNPYVSVVLEDGDLPAVAEGTAAPVDRPYPDGVVKAFHEKYAWDIRQEHDTDIGVISLWEITVRRWLLGDPTHD